MIAKDFINAIAGYAVEDMKNTNVLASVTIAQGALESAWGASAPNNNLFGIKGTGSMQTTQEYYNGEWVTVVDGFRAYESWYGSIVDHSLFLVENRRYTKAGFFDCCSNKDYIGACWSLQTAGYATDPSYATKLISIIENHNLHKYDVVEVEKVETKIEEDKDKMALQINDYEWKMQNAIWSQRYNKKEITDWKWLEKIRTKSLTSGELAFLNSVIAAKKDGLSIEAESEGM